MPIKAEEELWVQFAVAALAGKSTDIRLSSESAAEKAAEIADEMLAQRAERFGQKE